MSLVPTSEHTALVAHLRRLVHGRLLDPLSVLLGPEEQVEHLRLRVHADAEAWAAQLLGQDEELAARVAVRLVAVLHPGDEPFDPPDRWWRTPLGTAVARAVGHTAKERVTFSEAGAMLGITRQGVHDLVHRDKLARHPEGGVTSVSVRDRLRTHRKPVRAEERKYSC